MTEMAQKQPSRVLRIGIIGCGEIAQVVHIPTINFLHNYFHTTYLCDISPESLQNCAGKVQGTPKTTTNAAELCASPDVDVVLIANANAYHVEHGVLALQNNKFCLIEKPAALNFQGLDRLIEAEKSSKGKVMVGTMRRYATAFINAVEEVGGMSQIQYARIRDIIGPNSAFVNQSGTYPRKFTDITKADSEDRVKRDEAIAQQALANEFGVPVTPASVSMLQILGGLGTHDLSAMREIIGMPKAVAGAVLTFPGIFSVLFRYENFPVTYESGVHNIPEFDAHIEVYSLDKIVRVDFDSPYIKGLPTTMTVRERVGEGFQERKVRKTYMDSYTLEFLEFYECVVNGKTIKTSALDARKDIELFQMILQAAM